MIVTHLLEPVTENMNRGSSNTIQSTLAIWGMACLKCASYIHDSLVRVDGVHALAARQ